MNIFVKLYRIFRNNRSLYYFFLIISLLIIFFFAGRIRMEEDISGISGGNDPKNKYDYVIAHHHFAEKLIVTFSQNAPDPDPGAMISLATQFNDSIRHLFDSSYIKEMRTALPDSVMSGYFDFFYENAPLYLDDHDYQRLEAITNSDSIKKILTGNYRLLVSPASIALKKTLGRDPLGITFMALKKLQSLQAGDDFDLIDGYVFSKDHKHLLMFITPANPPSETSRNGELIAGIDRILGKITSGTGIKASYFGSTAVAVGNAERLKKDIILTIGFAIILIIIFLGLYFRNLKIPLLGFLPALFGGGFALAVMAVTKGTISAIALGVGSVILGLIVDYALYIITVFRRRKDLEKVLSEMSLTVILCALTSAGAFLCLTFLKSTVLHDLGWFAALSVTGAAFFALLILPQLIKNLPGSLNPVIPSSELNNKKQRVNLIDRFTSISFEKNHFFVGAAVILIILGFVFFRKAGFEKDMMSLNYMTPALANAEVQLDRITSVTMKSVYVISTGNSLDEALKINEKAEKSLKSLKTSGVVLSTSGVGALLLSDSLQRVRIERWEKFMNPERKEFLKNEISRRAKDFGFTKTAFEPFFSFLDKKFRPMNGNTLAMLQKDFLSDFISRSGDMTLITAVAKTTQENKPLIYKNIPPDKNIVAFDRQQITERFVMGVQKDFNMLVRLSMIFVTVLLLISFGRIEIALMASVPMFAGWIVTLGFMGLTGINFNIFNIIISSFIFGLGVDYSILMMSGLLHKYKYGVADISAYRTSILLSSFTTIIGVAVLFFAKHPALNSIALISVAGVTVVVLITFTLQPLVYWWLIGRRRELKNFPVTFRIFLKTIITWGNIVLIALIMFITGMIIFIIPFPEKKKQYAFHYLFSLLSRIYIAVTFPTNRKLINLHNEDFSKPAVIISNHQSLIETPAYLRLHPKILILTNEWVWNSMLFGPIARMASFFNAEHGIDAIIDKLQEKVNEGYSVLIFPEAHRSKDGHIQRFHRGAFYLAEKLKLDILPVVIFGSGDFLGAGAFWGHPNGLKMKILQRIAPGNTVYGRNYSERTKGIRELYRKEYALLKEAEGTGFYYRKKLILNYVYKGPVLEWYLRVKMQLAGNYEIFNRLMPRSGKILDIGCGYGFISYMLMMTSGERNITGVDYDDEKIAVAAGGYLKNDRISFINADITSYQISKHNGFLLSDVLHYLRHDQQENLISACIENLEKDGVIVIRDADSEQRTHKRSKLTEFLSTRIIGFNKTADEAKTLNFTSIATIRAIAEKAGCSTEVIKESRHTSNTLFLIRK